MGRETGSCGPLYQRTRESCGSLLTLVLNKNFIYCSYCTFQLQPARDIRDDSSLQAIQHGSM